jgi:hypothetical protein
LRWPGWARDQQGRDVHHWFLLYIDPGAGSLIVQATIAALLSIPYFLRHQISRAVRSLGRAAKRSARAGRPVDPGS